LKAATRVLNSGHYIRGPELSAFETEFAKATGSSYCVGVSSGTQALQIALQAVGVEPGDEVLVPAFTFIATAFAVSYLGATPVFVDIDPITWTMDPTQAAAKITNKTKAIMPVHIFGYPADMNSFLRIARERNLKIVEDCAQAYGSVYDGKRVGTIGDIGCFSFYPTKNLGAAGDAGAVVTSDKQLFERCMLLRNIGALPSDKYRHLEVGYNYRLDDLQAAILRVKMKKANAWLKTRQVIAAYYRKSFDGLPLSLQPKSNHLFRHSYHLFVVRTPKRNHLAQRLWRPFIETGVYYPIPLHLQPAYASLGYKRGDLPETERACEEVLAIPAHAGLSLVQRRRIASNVQDAFR
jgi:dTDP-4-amino-4,6-dideoxygalactose transaminase